MKQKRKRSPENQQPADGKLLQWHPAFYADLQIEFREETEKLKFEREYLLSSKPMAIDVLIIKKKNAEPIHKNIGKIFRKYNIIEYKSPSDSLSVDDFYKVYGYTNFYKKNKEDQLYQAVMEIIVKANENRLKEGKRDMCNALLELMKDELDEKREEGIREGIKEGESLGENRINQLILKLSELNRTDEILKAAADREYQKKLLKEFGL